MTIVWVYTKSLVIGAAFFFAFRYVGSFSSAQSWALTIIAWLGYGLYVDLRARFRVGDAFSPFWVRVSPNWYDLLRDYRIVETDEKTFWHDTHLAWRQLQEKTEGDSADIYSVLRDDIVFTMLKPGPFDGLLYWNSHRIFRSEVDFGERIEEIKITHPTLGEGWDWSPDVYLKWGRDGYELGLEVNAEWWERTCAAEEAKQLAKIKSDPQHLTGTTRLAVATLPYSEFAIYAEGNVPASWYDTATLKKQERNKDAELAKAGWKREESDWESHHLGAPEGVKHKYFTVEHKAV